MIIKTFIKGPIDANNYLLIDEETNDAVLIDCSAADDGFLGEIKKLGVNLKYILLTHGHFDHLLGVDKFHEVFGVGAYVAEEDMTQVRLVPDMMQLYAGMIPVNISSIKNFVKDGDKFNVGNIKIKAISTPGHTEGGMCYLVDDKLFSGDTLFQGSVGRCDLTGGDWDAIKTSIKDKLFKLPASTVVYPGHGAQTTIDFEKKYNEIINL